MENNNNLIFEIIEVEDGLKLNEITRADAYNYEWVLMINVDYVNEFTKYQLQSEININNDFLLKYSFLRVEQNNELTFIKYEEFIKINIEEVKYFQ